ncbi:MAG: hypothetical protein EOO46_00025 [Flavobacterium sp.]|nr:MAG: hypothetical protein EOO46_00025 [Flavobacterium sp.]
MNPEQSLKVLSTSLFNLQKRKGRLTIEQVEAEVINLSCLEILTNKKVWEATEITEAFSNAAMQLIPQYGHKEAMHAMMSVPMNVQWDGMWEFLRNYFLSNHGLDIDGANDAENKIFYSTRHTRFEHNLLVNDSLADRTIDIFFSDNRKVILVNILPTLHSKKGYLSSKQDSSYVYKGSDTDYRFTVMMDEIEEIQKFILEMPNRDLRIEYFE